MKKQKTQFQDSRKKKNILSNRSLERKKITQKLNPVNRKHEIK